MTIAPEDEFYGASGWTGEHDYDPGWDYEVRADLAGHPLMAIAQAECERIVALDSTPWSEARVFAAELDEANVSRYCFGTARAPVIVLDIEAHSSPDVIDSEAEVRRSVAHGLRLALQELAAGGEPDFDLAAAEDGPAFE